MILSLKIERKTKFIPIIQPNAFHKKDHSNIKINPYHKSHQLHLRISKKNTKSFDNSKSVKKDGKV